MNLKYQYQKRIDAEKVRYEALYVENHRLISKLKQQEDESKSAFIFFDCSAIRKIAEKKPPFKTNEVNIWKNKYKEMEKEKQNAEESLRSITCEYEGETREYESLRTQLDYMKMHFAHLAPKAVQLFETEYMELMDEPTSSKKIFGGKLRNEVALIKSKKNEVKVSPISKE